MGGEGEGGGKIHLTLGTRGKEPFRGVELVFAEQGFADSAVMRNSDGNNGSETTLESDPQGKGHIACSTLTAASADVVWCILSHRPAHPAVGTRAYYEARLQAHEGNYRDVLWQGDANGGLRALATELGWDVDRCLPASAPVAVGATSDADAVIHTDSATTATPTATP